MGLKQITIFIILIAAFGLSSRAYCTDDDAPVIHIQQNDPLFESQKLAGPRVQVHSAAELDDGSWKVPAPTTRDEFFEKAGLGAEVKSWDALDRDVLFVTAQRSSGDSLVKTYPKLSKQRLLVLSKLVKEKFSLRNESRK